MRALLSLVVPLLAQLVAGQALAHAELRGSDPAANAVLETAPDAIHLTFSEPVSPLFMRFVADGEKAVELTADSRDGRVTIPAPEGLGRGTHVLSWRVVSADGHPIGGTLIFSVGEQGRPIDTPLASQGTAELAAIGRFALTLALVMGIGATVFLALVARGAGDVAAMRRVARAACVLTAPLAALAVAAQGLDLMALPPGAFLTGAPWHAGALSPTGLTALAAVVSAAVALVALSRRGRSAAGLGLLAWALAAVSFALSGHATVADPRWLSSPSVALHALALIFWLGSLVPLLILLRSSEDPTPAVRRFSTIATPLVLLLVATGVVLTLVQAGSVSALVQSAYGRVLAAKLVAVAALLALAARNRLVHTPALAAGFAEGRRRLDRSIRREILLGLVIIALASSFRLTPPPRSLSAEPATLAVMMHGRDAMAELVLKPGRVGANAATLRVTRMDGAPMSPLAVTIEASLPERGIEPIRVQAEGGADGVWRADPLTLPLAGDWTVEVSILISDFAQETVSATLPLGSD